MSKNSRIYPSYSPSGEPAEQLYALPHKFANTQPLLRRNADQTMTLDLVRNQLPEGDPTAEVDHVENRCCWEREAEPEMLEVSVPEPSLKTHPSSSDVPFCGSITIDSVCKNLILFDDFFKTQTYYNRIGYGQLELNVELDPVHRMTLATILVGHLILSQASSLDRSTAIQMASQRFIEGMKDQCYHVKTLDPKIAFQRTTNIVQRVPLNGQTKYISEKYPSIMIDPAHYEQIMRDFQVQDNGYHLVFAADFSDLECNVLHGIANRLNIPSRTYVLPATGQKRFLVLAKEIRPQDVVRRIGIEQDAELGFQYRVIHPQRRGNVMVPKLVEKCSNVAEVSDAACGSSEPTKPKTKQKKLPEALACLTKFAPIQTLRSVDDVYRNLVLVGTNFEQTAQEFLKIKVGALQLSTSEYRKKERPCGFKATVQVGKFLLAEARGVNRQLAKNKAKVAFFKRAKMFSYQIITKETAKTEIFVTKQQVPDSNNCQRFFEDFSNDSLEKELVFGSEFSKADFDIFTSIAKTLNLKVCSPEQDKLRRLRILGQRIPALAIVERIVLTNDAYLSAIYEVIPPKIGARSVESASMD